MASKMPAGRLSLIAFVALLALLGLTSLRSLEPAIDLPTFSEGKVRDADGPVPAALVRWKAGRPGVLTDALGRFRLPKREAASMRLTVSKEGYLR